MSQKYHQLKQTKYIWLRSQNGRVIRESPDNTTKIEIQWDNVPDLKLSNNATVTVCGFQGKEALSTGRIIRCKNVPSNQVYDSSFRTPIIYMVKSPDVNEMYMEPVKYMIGDSSSWTTINMTFGTVGGLEAGIAIAQEFVIGLKFEDYDVIEVQSKSMPEMKGHHQLPQDRLHQKYI